MANTKISGLTTAAALAGTEALPGVQGGGNVKITPQQIKDFVNAAVTGYSSLGGRLTFPGFEQPMIAAQTNSTLALNAAGLKYATAGYVRILDGAASKTISGAGGKIHFLLMGTTTFAAAAGGTTLEVGIQGVGSSAGPIFRPNDAYDVSAMLESGTDTLATGWNSKAMTVGSKTITNGELVAVVVAMANRSNSDQVTLAQQSYSGLGAGLPSANGYTGGAWGAGGYGANPCVIEFDDGTLGVFEGVNPASSIAGESFSNATNPRERGVSLRLPFSAKVSGYKLPALYLAGANSDFKISLYANPEGTPVQVAGSEIIVLAEQTGRVGYAGPYTFVLPADITLLKNTDYALIVEATGTANVQLYNLTYANAAYKKAIFTNGDYISKLTRNGSGPFAKTTTSVYAMGVVLSQMLVA